LWEKYAKREENTEEKKKYGKGKDEKELDI
jgi:hypothetical protein